MALISAQISAADTVVTVTLTEGEGERIRIHTLSAGYLPAPSAGQHATLLYGGVAQARFPIPVEDPKIHLLFPAELLAPRGDGAGAGTVALQLPAGGASVVGYVAISYDRRI